MADVAVEQLKRLVHEIHRRSLWQVLAIYVGASWVVFEVVQTLTEGLGLPEWFPAFALGLLLIGLPIVLATAFVQEGFPPKRGRDPTLLPTAEPESQPVANEIQGARRLLTWRNVIAGGVLALALWGVVAAGWLLLGQPPGPAADRPFRSIAVLPFADMSPEGDQQYFADGVAEEILDALARLPRLDVKARTSSFRFRESALDVRVIGDSLGANALLEGSVRKSGERVKITAQLIDARSANHLWSESYERRLTDIFAVQEEIAREVVEAIQLELGVEVNDRRIVREATTDPEAYELYLRGRHLWWGRSTEELVQAIDLFQKAIQLDPGFAAAYVAMANAYLAVAHQSGSGLTLQEADQRAAAAARRALELDSTLAEPHATLGGAAARARRWSEAEEEFRRGIELNSSYATAHHWYAILLGALGRTEESLAEIRRARELDPLSLQIQRRLGYTYYLARRYDEAIEALRTAIELVPDRPEGRRWALVAEIQARAGRPGEARSTVEKALRLNPSSPTTMTGLAAAVALGSLGDEEEARRLLNRAKSDMVEEGLEGIPPYRGIFVAGVHAALSEPDSAFRWLDEVYWDFLSFNDLRWPRFDPIRDDPRYGALLDRYDVPVDDGRRSTRAAR